MICIPEEQPCEIGCMTAGGRATTVVLAEWEVRIRKDTESDVESPLGTSDACAVDGDPRNRTTEWRHYKG